jgi:hypothetical protein
VLALRGAVQLPAKGGMLVCDHAAALGLSTTPSGNGVYGSLTHGEEIRGILAGIPASKVLKSLYCTKTAQI